jgi:3-oxoacyl-[acyl-carrier-protein] synthase-1
MAIDPNLAKEGVDGVPFFVVHAVPVVGTGSTGLSKLLALAKPALQELLHRAPQSAAECSRTGLCVNVSDGYFQNTFGEPPEPLDEQPVPSYAKSWMRTVERFPARLCAELGLAIPRHAQVAIAGGHAGLVDVLRHAAGMIRNGSVDRCIVGGVESCIEPTALQAYAAAGVVKTAAHPTGFVAGEASAFLLLEQQSQQSARQVNLRVAAVSDARDEPYMQTDAIPCGRGLAEAIMAALGQRADAAAFPGLVVLDLNGTESRAADWGHALVHLRARLGEPSFEVWHPAESFGETGAAAGILAIATVARAIERGYAPDSTALVVVGSDDGRRGAVLLEA